MNLVKGESYLKKFFVSFVWFKIVCSFGILCFWIFTYPYICLKKITVKSIDYIFAGIFVYFIYLIFRILLSSLKSTFFELKIKDENEKSGNEKYLQWYIGKEPFINDNLKIYLNKSNEIITDNDYYYKYHYAENLIYETYANRRFWNTFCPFIRTDEITLEELDIIIERIKNLKNPSKKDVYNKKF